MGTLARDACPLARHALPLAVIALLVAGAPTNPAHAQAGSGTVWVALDRQPAGTPAQVILNHDLSSPTQTWFDVYISGFYATTRVGPDAIVYQDLSVPGLPSDDAPGEPRLPIVRAELGIVTDAAGATLAGVNPIDVRVLPGYMVWPSPIPAIMHEGTPAQFVRDPVTYASTAAYPPGDGAGGATRTTLAGIPAALCTAYPVHWNPTAGTLSVAAHMRFGFAHGGNLSSPMSLTGEHGRLVSPALLNWGTINGQYTIDWTHFNGAYLFVYPAAWKQQLQKLINEKKTRGYLVAERNVPLSGETCAQLRATIQSWYAGTPAGFDHYCLLVGTYGSTPPCASLGGQLTDKVLSSVDSDMEPEIYLGRLLVGNASELDNQVQKILAYEIGPQINNDGNVLLIAHQEQSNVFDFQSYQEKVHNSLYAQVTPNFITCYGTNPSVDNPDITNGIEAGVGLAAYFGHGTWGSWWHWASASPTDSFAHAEAQALNNGALTPVVWSLACETGDLRKAQSLASGFMKNTHGGAVAFYGAVDDVYGDGSQMLNDSLFQAVYGQGITRHAQAILRAEHALAVADPQFGFDAVIKYVLYGDPEMEIKRHNPGGPWVPLDIVAPITLFAPCPGAGCCPACPAPTVDIQVRGAGGAPVPRVKVGLWKPGPGGGDELLDNRYTDADGWVHIPAPMITGGMLYFGFDDGDGRAGLDSIVVEPTAGVGESGLGPPGLAAIPSVTRGPTRLAFGRALDAAARVRVFAVDGRLVRTLDARAGAASLVWDGRDRDGRPVRTGLYLAQLDAGPVRARTRIIVLR